MSKNKDIYILSVIIFKTIYLTFVYKTKSQTKCNAKYKYSFTQQIIDTPFNRLINLKIYRFIYCNVYFKFKT